MKYPNLAKSMLCGIALALAASLPAQALELTAGHVNPPGEPCYEAFNLLQKKLAAGSTGLTLKIFPQSQIGDEKDAIEQVKMGALTMTCVASANLSAFAPIVGVFDIPFLFRDGVTHPWLVADGPIGKDISNRIEQQSGLHVLSWWSAGVRHVFSSKTPIKTPADMKNMKIRVIGSPVYIDTFTALGAKPTPMPYGEVYTSLATHTIDAAENDSSGYRNMKFYEQAPQLSLTGHFFLMKPVVANPATLAKLSPEQRKELDAAMAEATAYQRKLFAENFDADIEWLKTNGKVTVTVPDRAAFEQAVKPVQEKYAKQYGVELVEAIRNTR
ncbi:TRAP transporter substrate-binding protein [Castellaniella hirudinis]|uniref:TRAP transporter substrate-binding protein n=1 Tax=Castellaniella hirudinis TaxID=1144617 RepID=A0ABV8RXT0_9BURK